jgi:hypothetical protein
MRSTLVERLEFWIEACEMLQKIILAPDHSLPASRDFYQKGLQSRVCEYP